MRQATDTAFGFNVDPVDGRVTLVHNGPSSKESLRACSDSQLTDIQNFTDDTARRITPSRDANSTKQRIERFAAASNQDGTTPNSFTCRRRTQKNCDAVAAKKMEYHG